MKNTNKIGFYLELYGGNSYSCARIYASVSDFDVFFRTVGLTFLTDDE